MDGTRWLDADEMRAWQSFLAAGALIDRRVDQQLKDAVGLSQPQYETLVRLAAASDGELRMTELADTLLTSKSGLTYQVTQLEKAGLVARRSCPSDVRGVLAVLTEAGRRRLEQAAPGHVALVRELLIDVLTPEQLAILADALGEVIRRAAAHQDLSPRERQERRLDGALRAPVGGPGRLRRAAPHRRRAAPARPRARGLPVPAH
jgi:DNA-binding MarR family transcriptional regulator